MAFENCLRVSSTTVVGTTRPQCISSFSCSREKLVFPAARGFSNSMLKSTISNRFPYSTVGGNYKNSRFVCNAREKLDEVKAVTDSEWDKLVLGSDIPVVVDFWAPWCGPCRMIAPIIDELAKEYAGKIVCYKLNTDDCPNIATQYGIRSIPTVLFFKNGEKKESIIGAVPKTTLSATIDKYLES